MDSTLDPKLQELLVKLQQKYAVMGQDMSSYLDGLLHSDYLTYWDYIHLDTLLSLQNPKTQFPDERVFIAYHQVTELFFNLVLWEMEQMSAKENDAAFFLARLERINRYFVILADSFSVMTDGMERDQFLKFRMSLLPASGFQSAQYRLIEICSTDMINLVDVQFRDDQAMAGNLELQLQHLYWRSGATELASGKKTLTLQQFEQKYMKKFLEAGTQYQSKNLRRLFHTWFEKDEKIIQGLREFDQLANVYWPLAHMRSAARYLHRDPEDIRATGGTNWQKYLPPRFQKVIFFPELWSEQEKAEWGRAGVERALAGGGSR